MIRAIFVFLVVITTSIDALAVELPKADRVVVKKSERKLILLKGRETIRDYDIALGDNPVGHKQFEGDERTPEGRYILDWRNPKSKFHRSIHISYPNEDDQLYALRQGRDPGGMIMIHGRPNSSRDPVSTLILDHMDWTDGCIAVKNREMDEIWGAVEDGTPIDIIP